jgi:long-chain fatty acid transport protein
MNLKPGTLAVVACLTLVGAGGARAGGFDIFGHTPRDIAMGGAMTAAVLGYSALYYNPAALTAERTHSLAGGLRLSVPVLEVERADPFATPETVLPDVHAGLSIGWVKPFGGVFEDRVAVGLSVALPAQRLVRVQGLDPAAPQFHLYQNLQDKLLIHLGVAGEPLEWLSIGVGAQILADLRGGVALDLDVLGGLFNSQRLDVTLAPTISPLVGVHVRPPLGPDGGQIKAGLTWRGENALRFDLPVRVTAGDALALDIAVAQTVLWTPHQFALGVAWTLDDPALTVALDLTLALWSRAPDPSPRLSVDVGGSLLEAFGLESALDLSTRSAPIRLGFSDTLTARIGAEWHPLPWLTLRGGYFWRPTPAPAQTGATAYLDNEAHVVSLGAGFSFDNPIQDRPAAVDIDIAVQTTFLPRRVALRPGGWPGGSIAHGGSFWHFSAAVVHRF